jgi:exonuclease VII small subunit
MKFLAKPVPKVPNPSAGLSFLQATLGFVLGCILVVAVMGLLEFRRVAMAATAKADGFEIRVSVLEDHVETLKAWNDSFAYELGELQKHYDQGMALAKQAEKNRLAKNGAK